MRYDKAIVLAVMVGFFLIFFHPIYPILQFLIYFVLAKLNGKCYITLINKTRYANE